MDYGDVRHRVVAVVCHFRTDAEWLAELLIDLEEDEPARLNVMEALRQPSTSIHEGSRIATSRCGRESTSRSSPSYADIEEQQSSLLTGGPHGHLASRTAHAA
jgi:hypothetical protein